MVGLWNLPGSPLGFPTDTQPLMQAFPASGIMPGEHDWMNLPGMGGGGILGPMGGGGGGGGLLGGSFLTPEQQQAMMAASAQLLQSGGWTDRPTPTGQALGQAMTAGRSAYNESIDDRYKRQLMESQIAKNLREKEGTRKYENLINKSTYEVRREEVATPEYDQLVASGEWVGTGDVKQPGPDDSVRAQKIADAKRVYPFLDEPEVIGLVDGYLDVSSTPDPAGLVTITNKATGTAYQVPAHRGRPGTGGSGPAPGVVPPSPIAGMPTATAVPAQTPTGAAINTNQALPYTGAEARKEAQERLINYARVKTSLDDALRSLQQGAIGPLSNIQAAITAGAALFGSEGFADNYENRATLGQFNQSVVTALANNPRVPVFEQERLAKLLPNPSEFFTNPKNAQRRLGEVARKIDELEQLDRSILGEEPLQVNERGQGTPDQPFVFRNAVDAVKHWNTVPVGAWWVDPETGQVLRKSKPKK